MATTNDLSNGLIIQINGEICEVLKYQHTMPGKGGAFYQVKLRNLNTGKGFEHRFRSGETLDVIRIEKKEMEYIYSEGEALVLMDPQTYQQINISKELIPETERPFLQENMVLVVSFEDERAISASVPTFIEAEIMYSEPAIKGDTTSSPSKPATIDNGVEIKVPLFITVGDIVKIDTRDSSYVGRMKKG